MWVVSCIYVSMYSFFYVFVLVGLVTTTIYLMSRWEKHLFSPTTLDPPLISCGVCLFMSLEIYEQIFT